MTTKTRTGKRPQVASVPAPLGLAEELLDQLAAFRPIEITTLETSLGDSEATIAQVVTVDDDGTPHNRGEVPIFWMVVRDQLRGATPEVPWIAGALSKAGRAYRLRELAPEELAVVTSAVGQLPE